MKCFLIRTVTFRPQCHTIRPTITIIVIIIIIIIRSHRYFIGVRIVWLIFVLYFATNNPKSHIHYQHIFKNFYPILMWVCLCNMPKILPYYNLYNTSWHSTTHTIRFSFVLTSTLIPCIYLYFQNSTLTCLNSYIYVWSSLKDLLPAPLRLHFTLSLFEFLFCCLFIWAADSIVIRICLPHICDQVIFPTNFRKLNFPFVHLQ